MDNVGRVEEFEGAEDLVDKILDVLCEKLLFRTNNSAQVSLHELTHKVDVSQDLSI